MPKQEPKKTKRPARPRSEVAQEELDTRNRVLKQAQDRLDAAKARVTELESEVADLTQLRDYAALNPLLPQQPAETPGADAAEKLAGPA